jgi:apolipoprotein N-acyltransferase
VSKALRSQAPGPTVEGESGAPPVHLGLVIHRHRTIIGLLLIALLLKSLIFAPINIWPLAFVCLVPWLVVVGVTAHAPRVYMYSYLFGLCFLLVNMRWLYYATGAGYVALSMYMAAYFSLVACPLRHMVRRRRWPLGLTLPFIWTGSELIRAVAFSGFPWFFLSHSVHGVLPLIQISDVVGAYGVSFVIAAVNGALADLILAFCRQRRTEGSMSLRTVPRLIRISVIVSFSLILILLLYGGIQLQRSTKSPGPRICVLQGDFLISVTGDEISDHERRLVYLSMLRAAESEQADLYLLPETPWFTYLNPEGRDYAPRFRQDFLILRDFATRNNAYVVTGSASLEPRPYDLLAPERRYNSAMVFSPDGAEPGRYDKVHLVYFGEIVPFRFGRLRPVYLWLNSLMPFTGPEGEDEYSLFPGDGFHTFTMQPKSQPGKSYRFGIPICYEDVMPYVSRRFVSGGAPEKQADFLLNISNDGWFGRSVQQPQHLAICVFRAVENRVGIARSVNTGISAFVEPTGRVHNVVTGDSQSRWPRKSGYAVANLGVDERYSLYSRFGDWFAWACVIIWAVLFFDYWIMRVREQK